MGRICVVNFVSLDGVIQSPLAPDEDRDGDFDRGGWVPPYSDDTVNDFMASSTTSAAGLLLGRRSYEILAAAWQDADQSEPAIAAMTRMPKYVVTSRGGALDWASSEALAGALPEVVADVRDRTEGDVVVFGAGQLVRGLAEHDLIDEYRLLVFPVVLGAGKRMFDERADLAHFTLADSRVADSGVVILTYARDRTV